MRRGHDSEFEELNSRQVAAVIKFTFPSVAETRGEAVSRLPAGLLNELRSCALGKLRRKELLDLSARIAVNSRAIEILAEEIKAFWE